MTAVQLALCDPVWTDPEPDDEDDDGPYCRHPDLRGQGVGLVRLHTMTDVPHDGSYL